MLKHEDNPQTSALPPPQPASEVRVTPEELAAAITRLEARKDANARQAEGTVAIGEVVQQLGLDVTPEEVLAEVQAQQIQLRRHQSWRVTRRGSRIAGGLALGGLFIALTAAWLQPMQNLDGENSQFFGETTASLGAKILLLDRTGPVSAIRTLAETPEGRTAFCSAETIEYAAMSRQFRFEPRPVSQNTPEMTWPVVKHDGQLYLRGWTSASLSDAAAKQDDRIAIYESPNALGKGRHAIPITIRLSPVTFADGVAYRHWPVTAPAVFYAAHLHLDKHAYEKWNP